MDLISTIDAAKIIGVSPRRVRQLVAAGRLPARQVGGVNLISRAAATAFRCAPAGNPNLSKYGRLTKSRK